MPAGKTTDALTVFTDLLPTFAELGGAKLPDGGEGCDPRPSERGLSVASFWEAVIKYDQAYPVSLLTTP